MSERSELLSRLQCRSFKEISEFIDGRIITLFGTRRVIDYFHMDAQPLRRMDLAKVRTPEFCTKHLSKYQDRKTKTNWTHRLLACVAHSDSSHCVDAAS